MENPHKAMMTADTHLIYYWICLAHQKDVFPAVGEFVNTQKETTLVNIQIRIMSLLLRSYDYEDRPKAHPFSIAIENFLRKVDFRRVSEAVLFDYVANRKPEINNADGNSFFHLLNPEE
jgi:hypothetical protein